MVIMIALINTSNNDFILFHFINNRKWNEQNLYIRNIDMRFKNLQNQTRKSINQDSFIGK